MFSISSEMLPVSLDNLPEEVRAAVEAKFSALMIQLYDKVQENLSGRVLQRRTGQLAESIVKEIDTGSDPMYGIIAPEPQTPKAYALEFGGKGFYAIFPTKAKALAFYWDKLGVMMHLAYVDHPPSQEYGYLSKAFSEMEDVFTEGLLQAIGKGLGVE